MPSVNLRIIKNKSRNPRSSLHVTPSPRQQHTRLEQVRPRAKATTRTRTLLCCSSDRKFHYEPRNNTAVASAHAWIERSLRPTKKTLKSHERATTGGGEVDRNNNASSITRKLALETTLFASERLDLLNQFQNTATYILLHTAVRY